MRFTLLIAAFGFHMMAHGELQNVRGTCQQKVAAANVEECQVWADGTCSAYDSANYSQCASTSSAEGDIQTDWAKAKADSSEAIQKNAQLLTSACAANVPRRQTMTGGCPMLAKKCNAAYKTFGQSTVYCKDFKTQNTSGKLDACSGKGVCESIECNAGRASALQAQESPQCGTGAEQQRVSR